MKQKIFFMLENLFILVVFNILLLVVMLIVVTTISKQVDLLILWYPNAMLFINIILFIIIYNKRKELLQ